MSDRKFLVGIDPGWKNLGSAVLEVKDGCFHLVDSRTWNPSKAPEPFPTEFAKYVNSKAPREQVASVYMERYVPYNNTFTAEAENITMLIGALREVLKPVHLVRAIDWKISLVKMLAKHYGFDNPSGSLDKKFSIAAATFILNGNGEFESDHEADAICLAAYHEFARRHLDGQ
ncbi:MAG TPA: hypothetical protein VFM18_00600 [Methanosarcina sp.]|nr:hypothetical protein [Methanosarcina sp.]